MDDDPRTAELECITAIFPEITLGPDFCAELALPVYPAKPVTVVFPAPHLPTPPASDSSDGEASAAVPDVGPLEFHELCHLPSIKLRIGLPEGYPAEKAPEFHLSTSPAWLPVDDLKKLEEMGTQMWEDNGRSEVVYDYIDHLQQAAETAFGYGQGKNFAVPPEHKIALLDYDIQAKQNAFNKETFTCEICLDNKKGSVCHKMIECGHVFCVECLQDFYNNAITEGSLVTVQCLSPGCPKKRAALHLEKTGRKLRTQLSPSELLQIPLEHAMVTRYVELKHKMSLETDKNTIYCPRQWCQGAARSKKHRKPEGLEIIDSDDEEEETESKPTAMELIADRLSVCEDCGYAFCSLCMQTWHGEFKHCTAPRSKKGLTAEDLASEEYVRLHTTPCPTCSAPAQKTHGCNHMICSKCNSHFCYLCSSWLNAENPYAHYNTLKGPCYQRLWELEGGDGDDVDMGYAGGPVRDVEEELQADDGELMVEEIPEAQPVENERQIVPEIEEPEEAGVEPAEFQQEGPLILRIPRLPPAPAPEAPAAVQQPARRIRPPPGHRRRQREQAELIQARDRMIADVLAAAEAEDPPRRVDGAEGALRLLRNPAHPDHREYAQVMRQLRNLRRIDDEVNAGHPVDQAEAVAQEEVDMRWIQRFVVMAMDDEEDLLDSDDGED